MNSQPDDGDRSDQRPEEPEAPRSPANGSDGHGPDERRRTITWRATLIGLLLSVVIGVLAPINDWSLGNTYFYGQHMPVMVTLVALGLAFANPLLGRFRFSRGECVLIVAVVLVLGGSVSTGLTRLWPATVAAPARLVSEETALRPLLEDGIGEGTDRYFLAVDEDGSIDRDAPGYDAEVEHFFLGSPDDERIAHRSTVTWRVGEGEPQTALALADGEPGAAEGVLDLDDGLGAALFGSRPGSGVNHDGERVEVLAVETVGIPWDAWIARLAAWLPLLGCLLITAIAISGVVRQQWIHHERLPYPIAQVWSDMLDRTGRPTLRKPSPMFLVAFMVPVVVLGTQGLEAWGALPLSIPTSLSIAHVFGVYDHFWELKLFFGIAAIAFLLPVQTSLSLWLIPVVFKLVLLASQSWGLPIEGGHMGPVSMGGFLVIAVMIAWIGRKWYWRLLRAAFSRVGHIDDPAVRSGAHYARLLLASGIALAAVLFGMGAPFGLALVFVLLSWALLLTIGRLVVESGIPMVNIPMLPNQFLVSIFGTGMGAAALLPLTLPWMITDGREHLVPFYMSADRLADDRTARGWGWPSVLAVCVVIGGLVSAAVMIFISYHHGGRAPMSGFWRATAMTGLRPMADMAAGNESQVVGSGTYVAYVVGGVITGLLSIARLMWSWWPLHPIGVVVGGTYAASTMWSSFLAGWLTKLLVQRYGGFRLYRDLRPAVLGLIAGEAVIAVVFAGINFVVKASGGQPPDLPRFLPI